jgi:hypothetical protein
MTIELIFRRPYRLFFMIFTVTVFYLMNFGCKKDVNFKGLILTGAFRDLIGLYSFFFKVGKSGTNSLPFFIGGEDIDDESELFSK